MRFLGGGVGHISTREAVNKFEQQVREMLGLLEETVKEARDAEIDVDMGDDVASSDLDDDKMEEEDLSSDIDSISGSESDDDDLEYLNELEEQYGEEEKYGYPES